MYMRDMLEGFKAFLTGSEHRARKNNPYYAMLILTVINVLLHLIHVGFFIFYMKSWRLALTVGAGALVCSLAFYLIMIDKGYKRFAEYMLSTEMFTMATLLCLFTKTPNAFAFYIFLGVFPHYFYTDVKIASKYIITILGLIFFNGLILFDPMLPTADSCKNPLVLLAFSINTFAVALIFETFLSLVSVRNSDVVYIESLKTAQTNAMLDPLTGLWNRRYLESKEEEIRTSCGKEISSVAMIDIDHFKLINDTYTHEVGDELLKHLANMLISYFRETDTSIRWGGEEFVILLTGTNLSQAARIMNRFREHVANTPLVTEDLTIPFTFTCGVEEVKSNQPISRSIAIADERLYVGKNSGRNCVVAQ